MMTRLSQIMSEFERQIRSLIVVNGGVEMPKCKDFTAFFNGQTAGWVAIGERQRKELCWFPNMVFQNRAAKEALVVLKQNETRGATISDQLVKHYEESMEEGRLNQCWVVILDRDGVYHPSNTTTIGNIVRSIGDAEPHKSKRPDWGDYHWLNPEMEYSDNNDFKSRMEWVELL